MNRLFKRQHKTNSAALVNFILLRCCLIFLFLLVLGTGNVSAEEWNSAPEDLSAQAIVDHAVARAEAQYNLWVDAKFESRVFMSIQSLDDRGQVTKTDQTLADMQNSSPRLEYVILYNIV
jgi:hypothetical protein